LLWHTSLHSPPPGTKSLPETYDCVVCRPTCSCLDAKVWYTLHITTSDIRGAGTDADVHIALTGSQGSSGIVALPSQPQQYQRGQRDKFRCDSCCCCCCRPACTLN
jgi:hypothetical protein